MNFPTDKIYIFNAFERLFYEFRLIKFANQIRVVSGGTKWMLLATAYWRYCYGCKMYLPRYQLLVGIMKTVFSSNYKLKTYLRPTSNISAFYKYPPLYFLEKQ